MPEITDAHLTADVVLIAPDGRGELHLLTVQRDIDSDAFPGYPALPGGYLDANETFLESALREAREETGVPVPVNTVRRIGIYDAPNRDPRGRVVSVAFLAESGTMPDVVAGDDASAVAWMPLAPRERTPLAFDHDVIVNDSVSMMARF